MTSPSVCPLCDSHRLPDLREATLSVVSFISGEPALCLRPCWLSAGSRIGQDRLPAKTVQWQRLSERVDFRWSKMPSGKHILHWSNTGNLYSRFFILLHSSTQNIYTFRRRKATSSFIWSPLWYLLLVFVFMSLWCCHFGLWERLDDRFIKCKNKNKCKWQPSSFIVLQWTFGKMKKEMDWF